jgi:hypothetical protein
MIDLRSHSSTELDLLQNGPQEDDGYRFSQLAKSILRAASFSHFGIETSPLSNSHEHHTREVQQCSENRGRGNARA